MIRYEADNNYEYEPTIDLDTGEESKQVVKSSVGEKYWELLKWAQDRRKMPFSSVKKQFAAMKILREVFKVSMAQVKERWLDLEEDKFWQDKLDFWTVVKSFDKKP